MTLPQPVADLVDRFHRNRDAYLSGEYNETQVRREFIDPMFESLGWDMNNCQGYAEAYKDVIHEDAIKIGGATKAPDYCFRVGGTRKFFLEAKKPSVRIHDDVSPAYQLRRYAWSAKLPLSVLTDFEELALYDCRVRPALNDSPATARVMYVQYTDYAAQWDDLAGVLSRDAVLKGSFDKYADSKRAKRGTAEVDAEFLKEIEAWRDALARNIAIRNSQLDQRGLNTAVQQTIDRIIFLRLCEDRGIETYGRLQQHLNGDNVYARLMEVFRAADDRYNSGLFHFRPEKGRDNYDRLTPGLAIDDKVLKDLIKRLYYPDSPYEFSVLPADILGQVYEQFLGKVIRLTKGHQARVEEKPEVRKAGGVYYTPTYIVDYIVKNTVGKLLEGKPPKDIDGSVGSRSVGSRSSATAPPPLRILDPACGSGSFLINAFQFLLDWYRDQYAKEPEKYTRAKNPRIYQRGHNDYALTAQERKRILLDHIYGVDIDPQAVEVTKLSLLLKVLEGENAESIGKTILMFHERALPDLNQNIKCGNSLIAPDFCDGQQTDLFNEEEMYRINAFRWNDEFPFLTKDGGFDAVIGNPPYIRIQTMKEWAPVEVEVYKRTYKAASSGNYDIYVVFIEKGLSLLNDNGLLGFICPHKFFNAKYGEALRSIVGDGKYLHHLVHFGEQQVFPGATTYTCLLFLSRCPQETFFLERVSDIPLWRSSGECVRGEVNAPKATHAQWTFGLGLSGNLLTKLRDSAVCIQLSKLASRIFQGFKTGADPVFILQQESGGSYYSKAMEASVDLEEIFLRPLSKSGDFKRYDLKPASRSIIYPYRDATIVPWCEVESLAPKTASYLRECRHILDAREHGRWAGNHWYCYSRQQGLSVMDSCKILTADLNPSASFCFDPTGAASFTGGVAGGYGITFDAHSHLYVLGVLNSKLLDWVLKQTSSTFRGNWYSFESRFISGLPIRIIDLSNAPQKSRHDKMVSLVQRMLDLHKRLQEMKTDHELTTLQRQITATDEQIEHLVYELYGLSKDEITIVEETNRSNQ
ncbi:MAG: Eco57I restriction-modification methylase domain-containing protein [Candidatus Hydrogenedentes bacterium]|nr:Eco57I restriction-modification methylase domain-containing protein [Candidatus Hydrogenedentota bacterium]